MFKLTYKCFSEDSILIVWPEIISNEILMDVRLFAEGIELQKLDYVRELNFVYNSLLIIYNSNNITYKQIKSDLESIYSGAKTPLSKTKKWLIPVCYDVSFGIDLENISIQKNIKIEEIIDLHISSLYTIHGIGFLPGFLYLGGLTEELYTPRLKVPRLVIKKGALGIGGTQTGIYPQESPGGWNIIGNTPVSMFEINKKTPCLFTPGDEIKFQSISIEEYKVIENDVLNEVYNLKEITI